jgi:hypothetical protein
MPARIPLDVDLEDRLLYGLTPTRLAYLVVALLAGFAIWSSQWSPLAVRASTALLVVGTGSVVSWGRWRGRPADVWLIDMLFFVVRTRRLKWNARWPVPQRRAEASTSAT